MYVSLVSPPSAGFLRQHSTAIGGPGCDCEVAAHARGLPVATAFRGFMACLKSKKCSPGAKSHAEIAALVRDAAKKS